MKYVLAPLAGFTNAPFRRLCAEYGADLAYTEMVSAAGLAHGSSPTRRLMDVMPGEGPVACQLFGSKPDELAAAAREATAARRFVGLDLNAGCPMPKVVHEGAGAALIDDPQLVHDCLAAMKRETDLPVSLKTRPGPHPDKVMLAELLDAAETAGCSGITLHGRFRSQLHGGDVHYDLVAELVSRAKIPVTGNGGVYNATTAERMAQTGVSAIMIGRAALANPWLFSDLKDGTGDGDDETKRPGLQNAAFLKHLAYLAEYHAAAIAEDGESVPDRDVFISMAFRTHLFRYFNGRPNSAKLRRRLNEIATAAEVVEAAKPFIAGDRDADGMGAQKT